MVGAGAGAAFNPTKYTGPVRGLDELDEVAQLTRAADEGLIDDAGLARLDELEDAQDVADTVQPVNEPPAPLPEGRQPYESPTVERVEGPQDLASMGDDTMQAKLKREIAELEDQIKNPGNQGYMISDQEIQQLEGMRQDKIQQLAEYNMKQAQAVEAMKLQEKVKNGTATPEETAEYIRIMEETRPAREEAEAAFRQADPVELSPDRIAASRLADELGDPLPPAGSQPEVMNFKEKTPEELAELKTRRAAEVEAQEAPYRDEVRILQDEIEDIQRGLDDPAPEGGWAGGERYNIEKQKARLAELTGDVDQVADDVARVEADADAAMLEADKLRATQEAGAIEAAKTAKAERVLSFKDWVAKTYPNGFGKKTKATIGKEYNQYKTVVKSGQPPGRSKPPKGPKKPKSEQPKTPKIDAVNLSAFRRATGRVIENIKRSMPAAGQKMEDFLLMWERFSAKDIAQRKDWARILREHGGSNAEANVVKWLDEGEDAVVLDNVELEIAQKFRDQLNKIQAQAETFGVSVGHRNNYFPHFFRDTGWSPPAKVGQTSRSYRDVVRKSAHLEKSREAGRTDYVRELDVLDNYIDESWRRISESINLGKNHEKLRKVLDSYEGIDRATADHVTQGIKYITQTAEVKASAKTFSRVRYIQGLTDLGLAGLYQPTQISHTTALTGLADSGKALKRLLTDAPFRQRQYHEATKSGALRPDIMLDTLGNTRELIPGLKGNYMHGVPTMDKFMRVHAFTAGTSLGQAAKAGDTSALKTLEMMGFDVSKKFSPEMVGRFVSDRTQFRTGPAHKPLWAQSSEWGKFLWQYKTFAYHHGIFVKDITKMAVQGNPKPLVTFLAGAGLMGELLGDLRAMIRGRDPFGGKGLNFDDNDQSELALHALFDRSQRIPLSHPIWRYIQNFTMIGGFGVVQETLGDQILYPGVGQTAGQTLGAGPANIASLADQTIMEGPRGTAQWAAEQVPVWGYDLAKLLEEGGSHGPKLPRLPGSKIKLPRLR
jgi:hypothetical protein